MSRTHKDRIIRAKRNGFMLNQHAPVFGDRRTKRNRSRAEQKRRAIAEQA